MAYQSFSIEAELHREMLSVKVSRGQTWEQFLRECFDAWKEKQKVKK